MLPEMMPSLLRPPRHPAQSSESSLCGRGVAGLAKQRSCKHLLSLQLLPITVLAAGKGKFFLSLLQCLEGVTVWKPAVTGTGWQKVLPHKPPTGCNL